MATIELLQASVPICYVRVDNAPRSIYRALQAGRYERADTLEHAAEWLRGQDVRLGSYGDPAAISANLKRENRR